MVKKLIINSIDPFLCLPNKTLYEQDGKDFLHVYALPLESEIDSEEYLTLSEQVKRKRFIQQADKDRFSLGRYLIRTILPKYKPELTPLFELDFTLTNKPFIQNSAIHFNLAHSGNWVALAVSNKTVGVDIELIKPITDIEEVMKPCFNDSEIETIVNSSDSLNSFYKFWTRKEAILKATGQGIATNLLDINVLDGEHFIELEQWNANQMYLNTYAFQTEYIISTASELELNPLQVILK